MSNNLSDQLSYGEHLDELRKRLLRIIVLIVVWSIIIFVYKEQTFSLLMAPKSSEFITYKFLSVVLTCLDIEFQVNEFDVILINTEMASQFMTHISTSIYLGILLSSPYIIIELFRFIRPALYDSEKRNSVLITCTVYGLFCSGVLLSYFVIFPISCRFLATYQVSPSVVNTITLSSYISSFFNIIILVGLAFEMPILIYIMGRLGLITSKKLRKYRPIALILIMVIAAIITPPDIFTLILVTIPLYLLFELSIFALSRFKHKQ